MVIAIFGPTASGKTAVAEAVADLVGGEVVSCDSMQTYRGLPILTCQPARPTRLVAIWPLDHEGSVGEYARLAHAAIDELVAAGRTPVVAGGTGLYLRAALAELGLPLGAAARGAGAMGGGLRPRRRGGGAHGGSPSCDPEAAAVVHANDRRRVVRALELAEAGESLVPADDRLWAGETRHPTLRRRPRRAAGGAAPPDRAANRGDVRRRRPGGGADRPRRAGLHHRAQGARARRGGGAAAGRGAGRDRRPHPPVRRLPAEMDAAHTRPRYGQCGSPSPRGRR